MCNSNLTIKKKPFQFSCERWRYAAKMEQKCSQHLKQCQKIFFSYLTVYSWPLNLLFPDVQLLLQIKDKVDWKLLLLARGKPQITVLQRWLFKITFPWITMSPWLKKTGPSKTKKELILVCFKSLRNNFRL